MASAAITSFAPGLVSGARLPRRHVSVSVVAPLGGVSLSQRISKNVLVKAAGDEDSTELPEVVKKLQDTWDKVDDKYAVATLGVVGIIVLWSATGMISAIDRLPVVPGILEIIGLGYTAWFVYSNLIYKPDREALVDKIKTTYSDIIGTS
ncbi:hypothetical protein LUZ61_018134 [Rhynchospora tenuis]|uniref:Cyanobacterial aminoacyl-tRNA synthetase CAAD domain-containing protein n=1 Tax=Rhynchospora tenuis TaxID=198213 RepID=A0AAD5Z8U9_9POAL|nr:hypothetical protein LUZ61_018134 [Rhynchospora tenuis]